MTPRRIHAATVLESNRQHRNFLLQTRAALWGAQGDPNKTEKSLVSELKKLT